MGKQTKVLTAALFTILAAFAPLKSQANDAQNLLDSFLQEENLIGGGLLVSAPDERIVVSAGLADSKNKAKVTPQTRFYIASSGKMMVAAAILTYVEAGAIALDEPVWPHIKNIEGIERLANSRVVTLRQLLNHSSGLAEYLTDDFSNASFADPEKAWRVDEALKFALDEDASAEPDSAFEYCNTNYVLLGHILAQLEGSLSKALESKIFSPARMSESSVGKPADITDLAHGYADDEDVAAMAWASELGDGPVITTLGDMEKFAFALFRDEAILGQAMLQEMLTGSTHEPTYGLGMGIERDDWGVWFGHSGSYDGFEADLRYYPDEKAVFVFMTNGNIDSDNSIMDASAQAYFGE